MTQNVYDKLSFFEAYAGLRRSIDGLDGAPEWPRLRALLPDLHDKRVVDLGCGYGWFCRWARAEGASDVLGIDVSERMLTRAMAIGHVDGIHYMRADLETCELGNARFGLAYSALVLHYLADVERFLSRIYNALVPGGTLVFSTEHPILTAPSRPGWLTDGTGRRAWPLDRYAVEGPRTVDWLGSQVLKYHRMIGTTLNTLMRVGFVITHVEEFAPTDMQIAADPSLAIERERPMFLLVSARRA